MNRLPDPLKPTAPQAGQPHINPAAIEFLHDIETAMQDAQRMADEQTPRIPTFYKDPTETPKIGAMPPVAQPGRAPMSQKASDASGLILSVGVATPLVGGGIALVLWATGKANPTVIGWCVGGAVALVVAGTAFVRSLKATVEAAPPEIHQHHYGPVHQVYDHSTHEHTSHGVWVKNEHDHSTNL